LKILQHYELNNNDSFVFGFQTNIVIVFKSYKVFFNFIVVWFNTYTGFLTLELWFAQFSRVVNTLFYLPWRIHCPPPRTHQHTDTRGCRWRADTRCWPQDTNNTPTPRDTFVLVLRADLLQNEKYKIKFTKMYILGYIFYKRMSNAYSE